MKNFLCDQRIAHHLDKDLSRIRCIQSHRDHQKNLDKIFGSRHSSFMLLRLSSGIHNTNVCSKESDSYPVDRNIENHPLEQHKCRERTEKIHTHLNYVDILALYKKMYTHIWMEMMSC